MTTSLEKSVFHFTRIIPRYQSPSPKFVDWPPPVVSGYESVTAAASSTVTLRCAVNLPSRSGSTLSRWCRYRRLIYRCVYLHRDRITVNRQISLARLVYHP
ncbi:hypothetical protein CDAR_258071 [Caerostris darwini]|uniref:Ig-like domain-containing protein n=1 Tax=Caerostris darwini TaxID=1538125 RepID=A0AAV4WUM1_9ARAC|nr:hypothetical protein CDAR_258071 [Caerostris darwini]